jgi:ABC-type bacteriocin/lantibiotic exporter with double-glycine peptidase domain
MILSIFTSSLEVVNIGALIPFIYMYTDAGSINGSIFNIFHIGFVDSKLSFTITFIILIILASLLRFVHVYQSINFSFMAGASLNRHLYEAAIHEKYENQLKVNSNKKVSIIASKSGSTISNVILPFINIINSIIMLAGAVIFLTLYYGGEYFIYLIIFSAFYSALIFLSKNIIKNDSKVISKNTDALFKFLRESFDGIRQIIVTKTQSMYVDRYFSIEKTLRLSQIKINVVSQFPKIFLEFFVIIAVILYLLLNADVGISDQALINLGVIVYMAQKFIPIAHQLYSSYISLYSHINVAEDVLSFLCKNDNKKTDYKKHNFNNFKKVIFQNVFFAYNNTDKFILKDVNFLINRGKSICIFGASGSGKSTLIDLLIGLLVPSNGSISVDDTQLDEKYLSSWMDNISYVPQSPIIIEGSVADNIIFNSSIYNLDKLHAVVKIAGLSDLISKKSFALDYHLIENGYNISGGQRQRLSIARSLYSDKEFIVMDEPTSSLDINSATEIILKLNSLGKTLMIISHQKEVADICDEVYEVINGGVKRVR